MLMSETVGDFLTELERNRGLHSNMIIDQSILIPQLSSTRKHYIIHVGRLKLDAYKAMDILWRASQQ